MSARISQIKRQSNETSVEVGCNLDGSGQAELACPIGFVEHMLVALAKYSRFDLRIIASGDSQVDDHHLCEDLGITLGRALQLAVGERAAICRFGTALVPMDEALVQVVLDFGGRAYFRWQVPLPQAQIGRFDACLVEEMLRALADNAGITLHVTCLNGSNSHHILEAVFKALGQALRQATRIDPELAGVLSSKGVVRWQAD